jgi:hypothetical protein
MATPVAGPPVPGVRRVRHQAREAVAVMVFSAATSLGLASAFLLLPHLQPGLGR